MSGFDLLAPPIAWTALLAVPVLAVVLANRARTRRRRLEDAVGPRLEVLAPVARPATDALRRALFVLGIALATLAALHPVLGAATADEATDRVDVVVALDVSRSMLATDVAPDRLRHAKRAIAGLLAGAGGDRVGLVVFAGTARTVSPLTRDLGAVGELLAGIDVDAVPTGGSDLAAAITASLALLPADRARASAIVLVTDGEDLAGRGAAAAAAASARGVRIHALGLGTARGAKIAVEPGATGFLKDRGGAEVVSSLDERGLARIAATTGGVVETGADADALARLHATRIRPDATPAPRSGDDRRRREDRYQLPLGAAILCLLLERALPRRRRR